MKRVTLPLILFALLAIGLVPQSAPTQTPPKPDPAPAPAPTPAPKPLHLKIDGETKVGAYKIVRLTAIDADPDAAIIWDVYPEDEVSFDERPDNVLAFVAPPGVYKVKLRTIKGSKATTARATVTIEGAVPPVPIPPSPGPGPGPNPGPQPGPVVGGPLWVVIVEETADAVATRGTLFRDKALSELMKAKGHKFRVVDKDVLDPNGKVPADVERFIKSGFPLPHMFLVNRDGVIVFHNIATMDAGYVHAALKNLGG